MRLYLTLLPALSYACGDLAYAGGDVSTRVDVYDDGWMLIVVPSARVAVEGGDATVEAGWAMDSLSGATQTIPADTLTSATWYTETRQQVDGAVELHPEETWGLGGFGFWSREPDYLTVSGGVSARAELFERMSTVTARYGYSAEQVGMRHVDGVIEGRSSHQIDLSWTQILSRRSTATFLATGGALRCGEVLGCMANPYRFVALQLADDEQLAVREHNPSRLLRLALAVRFATALDEKTALHTGYRLYGDSWAIVGHTLDLSLTRLFAEEHLSLRAITRVSTQGSASFYADQYVLTDASASAVTVPTFRTADRELAGLESVRLGGRVGYTFDNVGPFLTLDLNARVMRTFYRYPEFSDLPRRNMWLVGGGVDAWL